MLQKYAQSKTYKKFIEYYGEDSQETKLYNYILMTFPENGLMTDKNGEEEYFEDVFIILSSLAILFGSNKKVIKDLEKAYDLGALIEDNTEHGNNLLLLLADALNFNYTTATTKTGMIAELRDKKMFLKHYQQIIRNKGTIGALETILNLFSVYTKDNTYSFEIEEDFEEKRVNINITGNRQEFLGDDIIYIELENNGETITAPQINQNHFLYKIISDIKPAGLTYNILINIMVEVIVGENVVLFNEGTEQDYYETITITFNADKGNYGGQDKLVYSEEGQKIVVQEVVPEEPEGWFFDGWDKPIGETTVDKEYTANWRKQRELTIEYFEENGIDRLGSKTIKANRDNIATITSADILEGPPKPSDGGTHYTFTHWEITYYLGSIIGLTEEKLRPNLNLNLGSDMVTLEVKPKYTSETNNLLAPEIVSAELVSHDIRQDNLLEQLTIKNNNNVQVDFEVRISPGGHLVEQGYLEGNAEVTLYNLFSGAGNIGKEKPNYSLDIRFKASWYNDSNSVRVQPSDWVFVGTPVLLDIEAEGINISNTNFPTKIKNISPEVKRFTYYTIRGTKDYMRDFGYDYEYWFALSQGLKYKITPFSSGNPSSRWNIGPYYSSTGDFNLTGDFEIRTKTTIPNTQGALKASTPIAFSDIDFKTDIGTRHINGYATLNAIYNAKQRLYQINIKPTVKALIYGIVEYKSTALIAPTTGTYTIRDIVGPGGKNFVIDMKPIRESNMPSKVDISIVVIPVDPNIKRYGYFNEYTITAEKVG